MPPKADDVCLSVASCTGPGTDLMGVVKDEKKDKHRHSRVGVGWSELPDAEATAPTQHQLVYDTVEQEVKLMHTAELRRLMVYGQIQETG